MKKIRLFKKVQTWAQRSARDEPFCQKNQAVQKGSDVGEAQARLQEAYTGTPTKRAQR